MAAASERVSGSKERASEANQQASRDRSDGRPPQTVKAGCWQRATSLDGWIGADIAVKDGLESGFGNAEAEAAASMPSPPPRTDGAPSTA